jgi:hypothetical protein
MPPSIFLRYGRKRYCAGGEFICWEFLDDVATARIDIRMEDSRFDHWCCTAPRRRFLAWSAWGFLVFCEKTALSVGAFVA